METNGPNIAIACQGGGSHAAFCAGALRTLLPKIEADGSTLVGISGTSGGAICALLAWYGWLKGGAAEAQRMLDAFWASNSTTNFAEAAWNDAAVAWSRALPFEVQFSPNRWPFNWDSYFLTSVWPSMAAAFGNPPPAIRGDFFQLGELIGEGIDFPLVAALGDVCSIPADIARWIELDYQASICKQAQAPASATLARRLEGNIRTAITSARCMGDRMDAARFDADAPLHQAFTWADAAQPVFRRDQLQELRKTVLAAIKVIPQLLLGAVDIGDGSFNAFSSEKSLVDGGISLKAVLASAALPWLFDAVTIERATASGATEPHAYWDGLFSQNPPLKNFMSDPVADERKPDQIWLLQINPDQFDYRQLEKGIGDRRNELAGNLSMNQEIAFIKAINKRLDTFKKGDAALKHMQVDRILLERDVVERATGRPLDASSKFDRSAELSRALIAHGNVQAQRFLAMRPLIATACSRLDEARNMARKLSDDAAACLACLRAIATDANGAAVLALVIDETLSPPSSARGRPDATVRWHAHAIVDGARARIEGEADFNVPSNDLQLVTLVDITIDSIVPVDGSGPDPDDHVSDVILRAGVAAAKANHAGPSH